MKKKIVYGIFAALVALAGLVAAGVVAPHSPTTPKKLGATGNFAYPVGPAGGVLSGTYPNPNGLSCQTCSFGDGGVGDAGADALELVAFNPIAGQSVLSNPGDLAYAYDAGWQVAHFGGFPVAQFDAGGSGCLTPSGGNKCVLELIPDGGGGASYSPSGPICTSACANSSSHSVPAGVLGPVTDGSINVNDSSSFTSATGTVHVTARVNVTVDAISTANIVGGQLLMDSGLVSVAVAAAANTIGALNATTQVIADYVVSVSPGSSHTWGLQVSCGAACEIEVDAFAAQVTVVDIP